VNISVKFRHEEAQAEIHHSGCKPCHAHKHQSEENGTVTDQVKNTGNVFILILKLSIDKSSILQVVIQLVANSLEMLKHSGLNREQKFQKDP
jgi:hypothetical protein